MIQNRRSGRPQRAATSSRRLVPISFSTNSGSVGAGDRAPVEAYRHAHPTLCSAREIVLELIFNEITLCAEDGEKPELEEYLGRFPELAQELVLQFETDRTANGTPSADFANKATLYDSLLASRVQPGGPLPSLPGYEVLEVLGRGGMAVVYKARHINLNRLVAIKMILSGAHAGPRNSNGFASRPRQSPACNTPTLSRFSRLATTRGVRSCRSEYVDGSLSKCWAARRGPPVRRPNGWRLCACLQHAHEQGIVHRDLKPANVLLSRDGTLKMTRFRHGENHRQPGAGPDPDGHDPGHAQLHGPGTSRGQARRNWASHGHIWARAILYELLTGRPPFLSATTQETLDQVRLQEPIPPSRWNKKLPRDLETICLHCLQKEPKRRCASADALASDLSAFLAGESIQSARRAPGNGSSAGATTPRRGGPGGDRHGALGCSASASFGRTPWRSAPWRD